MSKSAHLFLGRIKTGTFLDSKNKDRVEVQPLTFTPETIVVKAKALLCKSRALSESKGNGQKCSGE